MLDNKRVVITYGTFDLFHKGHYNILKRAKELGDYLIVGVTSDTYDMERGKLSVRDSLAKRIESVRETGFADKIIVEEYLGQKIQDILQYQVDVLVVGSDWKGKFDHMRKYCEVVYLERTKDISSTLLRENDARIYSLGIVTESMDDDEIILESKYVSGIHARSVFSEDADLAERFCQTYELENSFVSYTDFLDAVDIVYIKCARNRKYEKIKAALERGKVVLSSALVGQNPDEVKDLYAYAKKHGRILIECIPTFYLQSFLQLLWNAKGNLIGDILGVENGIKLGQLSSAKETDLEEHIYFSALVANKIIGNNLELNMNRVFSKDGKSLTLLTGQNEESIYICKIGDCEDITADLRILGTKGSMFVPADWWNIGYFEIEMKEQDAIKRYSFNFEGNGLRYVLVSVLDRIKRAQFIDLRLTENEVLNAIETMKKLGVF